MLILDVEVFYIYEILPFTDQKVHVVYKWTCMKFCISNDKLKC